MKTQQETQQETQQALADLRAAVEALQIENSRLRRRIDNIEQEIAIATDPLPEIAAVARKADLQYIAAQFAR